MLSDSISYTSSNQDDIQRAVIMFHGYGSDGKDLISLAPSMAKKVPNAVFYSPNAPIEMEYGYKWFDLDEFAAVTVFEQFDYLEKLMERARPLLPTIFDFIQQIEQKHNLKSSRYGFVCIMSKNYATLSINILSRNLFICYFSFC